MSLKGMIVIPFLFWTAFSCTGKSQSAPTRSETRAVVIFATGAVSVDDRPAAIGDLVGDRSRIATGRDGVCEIVFNDKNIIRVRNNTEFTLDFSGAAKAVDLKRGTLINVLERLAHGLDGDGFTVRTPTAACGVKGTIFFVKADENSTYVCVCNGTVTVSDEKGNHAEEIKAEHHIARLFTRSGKGTVVKPAPMLYHTDADMEKAAEEIGHKIDWTKIE